MGVPSTRHSLANNMLWQSSCRGPFRDSECDIIVRYVSTSGCVLLLLVISFPSTVSGAIISIIINAINTVLKAGPWANIRCELIKRLHPGLTHRDPPSSVVAVLFVVSICASLNDSVPNLLKTYHVGTESFFSEDCRREGAFWAHATNKSLTYDSLAYPSFSSPLSNGLCFPVMRYESYRSPVRGLIFPCCPSHISRTVSEIVVNSFQCCPLRTWPDVGEERFEGMLPFFANCNSSLVVILGVGTAWSTSTAHTNPSVIGRRCCHAMCFGSSGSVFSFEASATCTVSARQSTGVWRTERSTVTTTQPTPFAMLIQSTWLYDYKPRESHSGQVSFLRSELDRLVVSHDATPNRVVVRASRALLRPARSFNIHQLSC